MRHYVERTTCSVTQTRRACLLALVVLMWLPLEIASGTRADRVPGHELTTPSPSQMIVVGTKPEIILLDEQRQLAFVGNAGMQDSQGTFVQGSISVIDTRSQTVRTTVPVTAALDDMAVDERTGRLFFSAVFVPHVYGTVTTVDERTGALIRTVALGGNSLRLAVDQQRGHVFVTGTMSSTSVLDATTGRLLASATPSVTQLAGQPRPTGAVALDQHTARLFTANPNSGWIGVLDLTAPPGPRMLVTQTWYSDNPTNPVVDERTGHVFMVPEGGILELNGHTGQPLGRARICSTARHSASLLVVEQTRRVFASSVNRDDLDGTTGMISMYSVDAPPAKALLRCLPTHAGAEVFADDPRHRVIIVGLTRNTVGLFDDRTGTLRRIVNVGKGYGVVTLDSQTGAAYLPYPEQGVIRVYPHGL